MTSPQMRDEPCQFVPPDVGGECGQPQGNRRTESEGRAIDNADQFFARAVAAAKSREGRATTEIDWLHEVIFVPTEAAA